MTRRSMTLGVLLCLAVLPALANGGDKGDLEIGLFGGFAFPDDYGEGVLALNPDDDVLYGLRVGYFATPRWSFELSGQQWESETSLDPSVMVADVDFEITSLRLNLLCNFRPGQRVRPFLTLGAGQETTQIGSVFDEDDVGYNAGAGLRFLLGETFGLRLEGRWVSIDGDVGDTFGTRQENLEAALGLSWAFGGGPPADTDGDGVIDRRDRCPDTPRGAVVNDTGCPLDGDGDGVFDGLDACPDTPAGVPVDERGCPRDSDGDGVHDGLDKCPDTPEGATVDAKGCPKDTDGDGVWDGLDKCPDTPKGATVDAKGCPRDTDGDGVWDGLDKCPDTPRGATVDATGCPKDTDGDGVWDGLDRCPGTKPGAKVDARGCELAFDEKTRTLVLEGVNFEFNSAELTINARTILDRVAVSLREWPEIRVEIGGHTDSVGRDAYNLDLSARRAESVRSYLAAKGIDPGRMLAKGYGESKPIADNGTEDGRKKNRRVELKKLD